MIFNPDVKTLAITESDLSIEEPINEAFNFKSVEDAERGFNKCKGESDFKDWLGWFFGNFCLTPILFIGGIPIPIFHIVVMSLTTWLAFPGSQAYKLGKCKWFIKKCDRTIDRLESSSSKDAIKTISGLKKLKAEAQKQMDKIETEVDKDGMLRSNFESFYSTGNSAHNYLYESAYDEYLTNKINNEDALARMLDRRLSTKMESAIILEAKMGDKIKSRWNKLVEFIKGVCAKFMETMSNVLLNEKEYLEKYKDIILKKKPKEDLKYSYTGDYAVGIQRLIKQECPIFNYQQHGKALKEEGDGAAVKLIMGSDFAYDEGTSLAEQFKNHFIAAEKGQSEGDFTKLNMTDIYNFCYNFQQVKKIVDSDQKHLEQSTNAIDAAIKAEINKSGEQTTTTDAKPDQPAQSAAGGQQQQQGSGSGSGDSGSSGQQQGQAESAYLMEADDAKDDNKPKGMQITQNTNAASQMGSYGNGEKKNLTDDQAKAGAAGAAEDLKGSEDAINEVTKMTDKWIRICRALITSKLTACEQISKDYMSIIRAHVRSYGGKDLKNKEDDKAPNKASNYRKADKEPEKKEGQQPAPAPANGGGDNGGNK